METFIRSYKRGFLIFTIDLLIALFAFGFSYWLCDIPTDYKLLIVSAVWAVVGIITYKLFLCDYKRIRYFLGTIILVNPLTAIGIHHATKYLFEGVVGLPTLQSILIAVSIITVLEFLMYYLFLIVVYRNLPYFHEEPPILPTVERIRDRDLDEDVVNHDALRFIDALNSKEFGPIKRFEFERLSTTVILNTSEPDDIAGSVCSGVNVIMHNKSLNMVRHINTLFAKTNNVLNEGGYIVCRSVTSGIRRAKIMRQMPNSVGKIVYFFDYITHRVIPKLPFIKTLYYLITKGERQALTRVEVLGRLYRAGFEVICEKIVEDEFYVIAKKVKNPILDDKPTNGVLIRLRRKGKNGKLIGVYKFRTMHSYSEYLQPYIYKTEGLCEGGKFADDYRVSTIGRFLRKTWLDELPMLINWLIGDLKIIGVRPLSSHYFSLYSKELQELRVKVRPGLLPPFYADMPKTLEEIEASELRYINSYLKSPLRTDIKYFWKCVNNIVFKGKRSK